jgi:hypothetical protein
MFYLTPKLFPYFKGFCSSLESHNALTKQGLDGYKQPKGLPVKTLLFHQSFDHQVVPGF